MYRTWPKNSCLGFTLCSYVCGLPTLAPAFSTRHPGLSFATVEDTGTTHFLFFKTKKTPQTYGTWLQKALTHLYFFSLGCHEPTCQLCHEGSDTLRRPWKQTTCMCPLWPLWRWTPCGPYGGGFWAPKYHIEPGPAPETPRPGCTHEPGCEVLPPIGPVVLPNARAVKAPP